jgi:hypothetical protein
MTNAAAIRFELEAVFTGVQTIVLAYRNHRGEHVVEVMQLSDGQIESATIAHERPAG